MLRLTRIDWDYWAILSSFPGHRGSSKVDVVVGEADPSSFVILYYQKGRNISVKLYGRLGLGAGEGQGGKPVLGSGEASWSLGGPNTGMGVTPTWRIVPRCCGGMGKGGTELS